MGHVRLAVCLPPGPSDGTRSQDALIAAIDEAMDPFQYGRGFAPERDIWGSWAIRGGSDGRGFWIRPGAEDDLRLVHDQPRNVGETAPSLPGMCAGGPRGLLDLDRPYRDAEARAGVVWDLWHRLRADLPAPQPWRAFLDWRREGAPEHQRFPDDGYLAQPLVDAFLNADAGVEVSHLFNPPDVDPVILLENGRDDFVRAERVRAAPWMDLLTLDGWWVEARGDATHGACKDHLTCPHRQDLVALAVRTDIPGYLDRLPDDITIVALDCHT